MRQQLKMKVIPFLLLRSSLQSRCQERPFPKMMGASDGETVLKCILSEGSNFLAAGHSASQILTGENTQVAIQTILDDSQFDFQQTGFFSDYSTIQSCANLGQNVVLSSENAIDILVSDNFGASYTGYEFKEAGGASDLDLNLQTGQFHVSNSHLFFAAQDQVTADQILLRFKLDGSELLSLSLSEQVTLTDSVLMTQVLTSSTDDFMGYSFRYKNNNFKWQNFILNYDFTTPQVSWFLQMAEQTQFEDFLLSSGDGDQMNLICAQTESQESIKFYIWFHGASATDLPTSVRSAEHTDSSKSFQLLMCSVKDDGGNLNSTLVKTGEEFWYLSMHENDVNVQIKKFSSFVSSLVSSSSFAVQVTRVDSVSLIATLSFGTQIGHKTYSESVAHVVILEEDDLTCFQSTNVDSTSTATFTWATTSFSDSSASFTVINEAFEVSALGGLNFDSTPFGSSDFEEPCEIDLKMNTFNSVTLQEFSSSVFSLTALSSQDGCYEDTSFCGATISYGSVLTVGGGQADWLTFDSGEQEYEVDVAYSEGDYEQTVTCTLDSESIQGTVGVTVEDNELQSSDCRDLTASTHTDLLGSTYNFYYTNNAQPDSSPSSLAFQAVEQGESSLPSFMSFSDLGIVGSFDISSEDCAEGDTYLIDLTATETFTRGNAQQVTSQNTCTISLDLQKVNKAPSFTSSNPIPNQTYQVYDPTASFQFRAFSDIDSAETFSILLSTDPPNGVDFVSIADEPTRTVSFQTDSNVYSGTYQIYITIADQNVCGASNGALQIVDQIQLTVIPFNHVPVIDPISNIAMTVYDTAFYFFPNYYDNEDTLDTFFYQVTYQEEEGVKEPIASPFLTLTGDTLCINPTNNIYAGTHNLEYFITDSDSVGSGEQKTAFAHFTVTITAFNHFPVFSSEIQKFEMDNYEIDIDYELPVILDEDSATDELAFTVTYTKELVTTSSLNFVSLDYDSFGKFTFTFNPVEIQHVGVYLVCLDIQDNDSVGMGFIRTLQECFEFEVVGVNNKPEFEEDFEDQDLDWGDSGVYFLPCYSDPDELDTFIEVLEMYDGSAFPPFLTFQTSQQTGARMRLDLNPDLPGYRGAYKLKITVMDSDSQLSGEQQEVVATFGVFVRGEVPDNTVVEFDYSSLLVTTEGEDELVPIGKAPQVEIISISNQGLVVIYFDQKLKQESSFVKFVEDEAIKVSLINNYDTYNPDQVLQGYSLEYFDAHFLHLRLNFTNSNLISNYQVKDRIQVEFVKNYYFFSSESNQFVSERSIVSREIPKQKVVDANLENIEQSGSAFIGFYQAFLATSTVFQVSMTASINMLWSLLNSLQVIVSLPLMNFKFPENAQLVSLEFLKVANLEVVNVDVVALSLLNFDLKSQPDRDSFREYSFDSYNFIMNGEVLFWILVFWVVIAGIIPFLRIFKVNKTYQKGTKWLRNKFFFNFIIRFLLESYLDLLLCSMLNLEKLQWNKTGEIVGSVLSLVLLLLFIFIPFIITYVVLQMRHRFSEKKFKRKFGDFYEGLKEKKLHALFFYTYFTFRRFCIAMSLFFFSDIVALQLTFMNVWSFIIFTYIVTVKPFQKSFLNYIEIFNETIILFLTYICWMFTDYLDDFELKFKLGWVYCLIILFNVFVNISVMVYTGIITPASKRLCPQQWKQWRLFFKLPALIRHEKRKQTKKDEKLVNELRKLQFDRAYYRAQDFKERNKKHKFELSQPTQELQSNSNVYKEFLSLKIQKPKSSFSLPKTTENNKTSTQGLEESTISQQTCQSLVPKKKIKVLSNNDYFFNDISLKLKKRAPKYQSNKTLQKEKLFNFQQPQAFKTNIKSEIANLQLY